jgi:hypothetical protein
MRVGTRKRSRRDSARRMVCDDDETRMRVREATLSFEPTQADLRSVCGYLEREIGRLTSRLATVRKQLGASSTIPTQVAICFMAQSRPMRRRLGASVPPN